MQDGDGSVEELVRAGWQSHATDPDGAFRAAVDAISRVTRAQQIPPLAKLIFHAGGEHLGRFGETLDVLGRLRSLACLEAAGAEDRAMLQIVAACHYCLGDDGAASSAQARAPAESAEARDSDAGATHALAASALAGAGEIAGARRHLEQAVALAGRRPAPENPLCRSLAATANNIACTLEELEARSSDADRLMLEAATIAREYWAIAGNWMHIERAEYRLAMVHCRLGHPMEALVHAKECLALCEANGADASELFFAHEILVRAFVAARERDHAEAALERASENFAAVTDAGMRDYCGGIREQLLALVRTLTPR